MRLVAFLALLLQLQPMLGSVLCFHDAEIARAECTMPHEGQPASSTLTTPDSALPGGCPSMGYCAPTAPAVPRFAEHLQLTSFVHALPALMDNAPPDGGEPAQAFHPPRA